MSGSTSSWIASQADSLVTVLRRTFENEPNFAYMVPDDDRRRILAPSFALAAIRAGELYGEIHTTPSTDGVAIWIRPEHALPVRQMLRMGGIASPFNHGWEGATRYTKLCASVEDARKRLAPSPHWYLLVFGVEAPGAEKSVGETIIEPVLGRADSIGMPCYLETFSEKRLAFYNDFGFRITGAGHIPDGGPNFWAMTRAGVQNEKSGKGTRRERTIDLV